MESQFFKKKEVLDKPLQSIFPTFWEEFRGLVLGEILLDNVLRQGKSCELSRFPLYTASQKVRYFDLKASPLKSRDKKQIIGSIVVFHDVTDKIHLENRLLRHARTTSLANLGASVAHEIRNPLNSISLHIQLIKEGLEIPEESSIEELAEITGHVLNEIRRLNEIITYFLEFSRPPTPSMQPSDLNEVVEKVVKLISEDARLANVKIVTNQRELPYTNLDVHLFSQAIYNIVLNGIQAMREQGGGVLEITTIYNQEYILLEIRDNGPGIQSDDPSKLFDLFFTTKEGGTGLGLPIANQIVEQHEGRMVAENNLDRGGLF